MRSLLSRSLAAAISLSLVVLSPGLEAYAAAGRSVSVGSVGSAPSISVAPVTVKVGSLNAGISLPGSINTGVNAGVALPGAAASANVAAPSALTPVAQAVRQALQPAAGAAAAQAPKTTLERIAQPLPEFSAQGDSSKNSSDADFMTRVGAKAGTIDFGSAVEASGSSSSRGVSLTKSSKKQMPDSGEEAEPTRPGTSPDGTDNLDELGNKRRTQEDTGPDSRDDGSNGGGWGAAFGATMGAGLTMLSMGRVKEALLMIPMLVVSLMLHEMGHARAAYKLGDSGPVAEGRASFRPKDLLTHVDPFWTVIMPTLSFVMSGALIGMANPVQTDSSRFDQPRKGMALVALAGPAVNLGLAVVGAVAFAGLGAVGFGTLAGVAGMFTLLNVSLAFFNLIPLFPLDGHHILKSFLPRDLAYKYERFNATSGMMAWMPLMVFMMVGGGLGVLGAAVGWTTSVLLGGSAAAMHLATGWLPAAAALGLLFGAKKAQGPPPLTPGVTPPQALDGQAPVEMVVVLENAAKNITADRHLSFVDLNGRNGVQQYAQAEQAMLVQIEGAGVPAQSLIDHGGSPIATYKRINAVTLRVDATRAPQLKQWLESLGHRVYDNQRRQIIPPAPLDPESADPSMRNAVSMAENLKITKADAVQAIAKQKYGAPDMGIMRRVWNKLTGQAAPQPLVGVIDTGADRTHPQLKRVAAVKNATTGPDEDDNGHGSWVTSMVLNYAPWLKSVTHYKTFVNGGATLDDILKALTMAGNDGNLVISNSWGSDDGDPKSPDSLLVQKLAQEGHIMVFAAGNAGPRANTIGSPAIVQYKDEKSGAIRVLAVAASDRDKKIAYFSSRGPGSPMTKNDPSMAHRPDLTGVGYNTDGAWPANLGPDRTDPTLGPLKAISGTSMSTPSIAGAISLLCIMFGVTAKGEKLDAIVNAIMATLEKTGQSRDAEGEGFINVEAAYKKLVEVFKGN